MLLRVGDGCESRSRERKNARLPIATTLGLLLLAFAVPDGSALPLRAAPTINASAPRCQGKARRGRPGHVSFSFNCGESQDVTAFVVEANRTLHSVVDPSSAFAC
jgi:hypothetical protein